MCAPLFLSVCSLVLAAWFFDLLCAAALHVGECFNRAGKFAAVPL